MKPLRKIKVNFAGLKAGCRCISALTQPLNGVSLIKDPIGLRRHPVQFSD